jgi:hypothetical protein
MTAGVRLILAATRQPKGIVRPEAGVYDERRTIAAGLYAPKRFNAIHP